LPYTKEQKRPSTYDGYRKLWTGYLKDRMTMPLRDFRTVHCEALLRQIVRRRDLSIRTMSHLKHFLSGIFRYAIRTGFLNGTNPVRDAVLPKAKAPLETHAYSLEEVLTMIELLPDPVRTIVAVAGFTGLRRGELRGLEVGDYTAGVLIVRRSIWKKIVGEPKGKRGRGAVPVIPWLEKILDSYIQNTSPQEISLRGCTRRADQPRAHHRIGYCSRLGRPTGALARLARFSKGTGYQSPPTWRSGHRDPGDPSP
jgi:integrase